MCAVCALPRPVCDTAAAQNVAPYQRHATLSCIDTSRSPVCDTAAAIWHAYGTHMARYMCHVSRGAALPRAPLRCWLGRADDTANDTLTTPQTTRKRHRKRHVGGTDMGGNCQTKILALPCSHPAECRTRVSVSLRPMPPRYRRACCFAGGCRARVVLTAGARRPWAAGATASAATVTGAPTPAARRALLCRPPHARQASAAFWAGVRGAGVRRPVPCGALRAPQSTVNAAALGGSAWGLRANGCMPCGRCAAGRQRVCTPVAGVGLCAAAGRWALDSVGAAWPGAAR